jgi:methylamine dehydrogenase accessory protein MauD
VTQALLVSNVLLWVVVVALAALVLALLRQIGVLHERVAPAGALLQRGGLVPGEAAPVLELPDWSGRTLRVGGVDPDGRGTLVYFLSPTCPVCRTLLPVLESVATAAGERLQVVLASDGERAEHEAFVAEHRLAHRAYVLSTALGLAYRVAKLPYAVLLDERGIVRAAGLVNTREHLESLLEARDHGVASVQEYIARARDREVA